MKEWEPIRTCSRNETRTLQFDSSLYERLALSRDKADIRKLAQEGQIVCKPKDLLKEPLVLEFLGLSDQARYSESDLETAIINRIEHFLLELGKGFLFEARQKRFTFDIPWVCLRSRKPAPIRSRWLWWTAIAMIPVWKVWC